MIFRRLLVGLILLAVGAPRAHAQGYRLRLDNRIQSVAFRGVELDSVPASATVTGPSGGLYTLDGFSVRCSPGSLFCYFFRTGAEHRAAPAVTGAEITLWGLGVTGLSLYGNVRMAFDLGDADVWPGTHPDVQLLEAFAEYNKEAFAARLGRQVYTSRLGYSGFDGARVTLRDVRRGFDAVGYLGEGLARGIALPVTTKALNPLDDFQPRDRQIVGGASLGYSGRLADVRLDYQREVDPIPDYFVSERAALATTIHPLRRLALSGGAEYDIAQGLWGSADATLRYAGKTWTASAAVQRYRPHFELWTIWGAFSPVAYHAVTGAASFSGLPHLQFRVRGTRFWYEETDTDTPLAKVEDHGWRFGFGASWSPLARWSFEVGHDAEFGPGASYGSLDATVTYAPRDQLILSLNGARLTRPLEFRVDEATLHQIGIEGTWRPSERWQLDLSAVRYMEKRDRPDAGGFDWDQTRLSARLVLLIGSADDLFRLPKGRRPTDSGSRTP